MQRIRYTLARNQFRGGKKTLRNCRFFGKFEKIIFEVAGGVKGYVETGMSADTERDFSIYSDLSKIILSLDMLLGRLEIFPLLLLLSPDTWSRRR